LTLLTKKHINARGSLIVTGGKMTNYLTVTRNSKPETALQLRQGKIDPAIISEEVLTEENVVACAKLIIANGGHAQYFYTQAAIIMFAVKNFNWNKQCKHST